MKTRAELLQSIATTIQDYREGEIERPTPDHVDRWVRQFSSTVQLQLLSELDHVLDKTYFSKETVAGFFDHQITHHELVKANPCDSWKSVNFLDIQQRGRSQKEILALFQQSLMRHCNLAIDSCGSEGGAFFYLDDVLFSGGHIGSDLKKWIEESAPKSAKVHVLVIGTHHLGEWQCRNGLVDAAAKAGKKISFSIWAALRLENRLKYRDTSEVLWPSAVPNDQTLANYMAQLKKFPFQPRTAGGTLQYPVFTGEPGRQVLERELLLAGARIRAACQDPKVSMRPLGYSAFGLGFGSTIVTYRNCPNNCPLAIWWGDPTATSGAMHWYPLLPRKTNAQSNPFADFDFEL